MSEQCPARQKLNILEASGVSRTVNQCVEPTSPSFAQVIEPMVCDDCPVRAAVVATAKRKQPPKADTIKKPYVSQPPKRPEDCLDMHQVIKVKCCGEVVRTNYCRGKASKYVGLSVTPAECNDCPVRRVAS